MIAEYGVQLLGKVGLATTTWSCYGRVKLGLYEGGEFYSSGRRSDDWILKAGRNQTRRKATLLFIENLLVEGGSSSLIVVDVE